MKLIVSFDEKTELWSARLCGILICEYFEKSRVISHVEYHYPGYEIKEP